MSSANGTISIDVAHEGVVAKTAKGDVRLGEVARGAAVAQSAFRTIEVGIHHGVAAWLDLDTMFGTCTTIWMLPSLPGERMKRPAVLLFRRDLVR